MTEAIRTWIVFKNTNNTLEGVEAFAFAMWQTALDEIEKESDNVVFMSDATVKLIKATLVRLEQENEELKKEVKQIGSGFIKKGDYARELEQQNAELKTENERLKLSERDLSKICQGFKKDIETEKSYTMKYYKTLQEIKAIAEQCMNKDVCYDCEYFDDCCIEDAEIPTYDVCKLLIQKITKAEEE